MRVDQDEKCCASQTRLVRVHRFSLEEGKIMFSHTSRLVGYGTALLDNTCWAPWRHEIRSACQLVRPLAHQARASIRIKMSESNLVIAHVDLAVDHKFVLIANISSWEQTKDWLFTGHGDGVHLQCLQETRLLDCATVHAKRHAKAAGWTAVMAQALLGRARGPGLGTLAMLEKYQLGLLFRYSHTTNRNRHRRRWHAASLGGFRRLLVCVNLYAFPGIGPAGHNLQILSEVGSFLSTLGRGWWIIGDFNTGAEWVLFTEVIGDLGATLYVAPGPTVYPSFDKARVIDHFILGPLIEGTSFPSWTLLHFTLTVRVCCLSLVCAHLRKFRCSDRRPEFQTFPFSRQ